jgi:hypothetical protein
VDGWLRMYEDCCRAMLSLLRAKVQPNPILMRPKRALSNRR